MDDAALSIGALARATGLPVSALRFYDAAGVLRPAQVDPVTGYRWYAAAQVHQARLIASLRRAGLPVADLIAVLAAPHDAHAVLARHRRQLEEDLDAARAHLEAAEGILAEPARCTVAGEDLATALAAVRHAVAGNDRAWPGLAGVLLHLDGTTLRLVACDRFRLAVATVPVREPSGASARVIAPLTFLDELARAPVPGVGRIALGTNVLEVLGLQGEQLEAPFPDYERLLRPSGSRDTTVASGELLEQVERADDVVVVRLDGGRVDLAAASAGDEVGFSRTFLLDAVRAAQAEHVVLALEDQRPVLRVSPAHRVHDVGLVMPIRLRH